MCPLKLLKRYLNKKKTAEEMEQHYQKASSVDYSLKDGETLVLQIKNVSSLASLCQLSLHCKLSMSVLIELNPCWCNRKVGMGWSPSFLSSRVWTISHWKKRPTKKSQFVSNPRHLHQDHFHLLVRAQIPHQTGYQISTWRELPKMRPKTP